MRKRANPADRPAVEANDAEDRQFVTALHRGLEILRCFKPTDLAGLGNVQLAERTGLPHSTVSRLTYTLTALGYLLYDTETARYRLGIPVLGLGYACLAGLKVRETAREYMREMAQRAGENLLVALGGRDDLTMVYIACARSKGIVSLQLDVGSRISLGRSAMGRAYLAGTSEEERARLMQQIRARAGEAAWPALEAGIEDAVRQVREKGFYTNLGEWNSGVNAVAVPYRSAYSDMPLMAFNCGGPAFLHTQKALEEKIGPLLVDLVRTVSLANGDA
ncbi:IclR family transcriptional regulator [Mesorhizobium xinjiangense]|uniref:IclR family transcriptional regulator n=1 Tax=Mesorhizobium xinjiangense TaxID=2678685 RepID=UPI0012EE9D21|nr:IclR family transcriptional regulator [Mesorhizobium xinjiangense]